MNAASQNEMERLREKVKSLELHIECLQEKQIAETCGCSHDQATDVCLGHSPMLKAALEREQALIAKIDAVTQAAAYLKSDCAPHHWSDFHAAMSMAQGAHLARRDLIKQAEALETFAGSMPMLSSMGAKEALRLRAQELRKQAEGQQ